MRCAVSSYWLPKGGHPVEEYEDAFFPRRTGTRSGPKLRLAVADGASESMLSGLWADQLVRSWCRRRRPMDEAVEQAMAGWRATLGTYLAGRVAEHRPIAWFERPGLERGAHATLLGIELSGDEGGGGTWTAAGLGDSCLFQVRDDELVHSFPFATTAAFGNAPCLVPSQPQQLERVVARLERAEGRWEDGDTLYLATDALAAWFLSTVEAGGAPWRALDGIAPDDALAFAAWTGEQRGGGRMRNDDVTLVRVKVGVG